MSVTALSVDHSSPALEVQQLSKRYGSKPVLDNVSLRLNNGELFGLIGLNGVGKTTMIKILLDLVKPDAGTARIYGRDCQQVVARENLAYVPEKFQPSRYLTGYEYLGLCASYYQQTLDKSQAEVLAEALDLDPLALKRKVSSYSKGMGQKLGLLGACLTNQPLLILDEPMSGLDPKARILLKKLMLEMKQQGKTIFFSSHILADIDEICDRIAVIHDCHIIFDGAPATLKMQQDCTSLEMAFLKAIGQ